MNPDYWEEIREPPIEERSEKPCDLKENSGRNTKLKSSGVDKIQGHRKEETEQCITKRICDSLLSSGSYSCEDFKKSETKPHRTRRIRFAEPSVQPEQEKKPEGCDSKDRRSDRGKKTQSFDISVGQILTLTLR